MLGYATRLSFKLLLNIEEFCNLVMLVSNLLLIIRSNEIDIVSVCVRACTRACMHARARARVCVCVCVYASQCVCVLIFEYVCHACLLGV